MAVTAFIFTALLFLPGDQLINIKDVRLKPGAAPFHIRRENTLQNPHHHPNVDKDNELPDDISAAVASPMTDENRLIKAKAAEEKVKNYTVLSINQFSSLIPNRLQSRYQLNSSPIPRQTCICLIILWYQLTNSVHKWPIVFSAVLSVKK